MQQVSYYLPDVGFVERIYSLGYQVLKVYECLVAFVSASDELSRNQRRDSLRSFSFQWTSAKMKCSLTWSEGSSRLSQTLLASSLHLKSLGGRCLTRLCQQRHSSSLYHRCQKSFEDLQSLTWSLLELSPLLLFMTLSHQTLSDQTSLNLFLPATFLSLAIPTHLYQQLL